MDGAEPGWWRSAVVYQVYPRSFADSDGDGIGDLRGLIGRLDHLSALGVDVLWVSPFYRSPQDDNGYDVSDHQDVDPVFGTLADVDELIAQLHARGIRLVLDVVLNHTSDEHPWFVASRRSRDDPKRDWYWWRPPRPGAVPGTPGAEPTNWRSFFAGSAWQYDEPSGEYYLHLFSRKQPDLDWENPEVRRALAQVLRWWVGRGIDGFRMDVINLVSKRLPLRDGPVPPGGAYGDGTQEFVSGPRIHEFLAELHAEVTAGHDGALLWIGEMPGVTVEEAVLFTDPARGEVDMVFPFEHVELDSGPGGKYDPVPLRLTDLKASLGRWQAGLAERGWNSLYWDNHDQPRAVSRFGCDARGHRVASAKLLATLLHLHRGTPFVYQGEELGMTNAPIGGIEDVQDIEGRDHHRRAVEAGADPERVLDGLRRRGRDNARTPMQWDAGPEAGFTTGTPWLPVNPNASEINAAAQLDDPDSVFAHFRRVIALRHELPVVAQGDFTMLLPEHEQVYAFTRRLGDEELLVLANVSCTGASVAVPDGWDGTGVLLPERAGPVPDVGVLGPWEARVHRRRVPTSSWSDSPRTAGPAGRAPGPA